MPQPALQVLLVEDNPGDAELVKASLAEGTGAAFEVHHAENLVAGLDRLARGDIDLVLLDVSLPDSHGLDGLNAARILAPSVPVVLLTGCDSQSLSLRAVQSGAQDCLVKGTVQGRALALALQQAIARQRIQMGSSGVESRHEPAKVVGFLGVKGGVGSSTIACHFATELKRQTGSRVLLMDLNLAGNALGFLMNANGPYGIGDACDDLLQLDEDRWRKLVASGDGGLDVLQSGGPFRLEENQPTPERTRFVLRFGRSLYRWIVVDLGRLRPFSARLAVEVGLLYIVGTGDVLGLHETKSTIGALVTAGFDRDSLALIVNQTPSRPTLSRQELENLLGVRVEAMLPECHQDFMDSMLHEKRLGQSREFQKQVAQLAAGISEIGRAHV